jgi:CRP-like cAMP-binding protein
VSGVKPGPETLRALPLLADLPPKELAALDQSADLVRFGPEETLFAAGDLLGELNYLLAGQIGATGPHSAHGKTLVDILLPVQPLCLPAVLLGLPAPFGAYTLTAGRLITMPAHRLRAMIRSSAGLARSFLAGALQAAHEQAQDICSLKLQSSPQRLAVHLLGLIKDPNEGPARIVLPFEKRRLAAKIGCKEENLSRAFAALRQIGVVTQRSAVIVRDVPALRAFANACGWRRARTPAYPARSVGA